MLPTMVVLQCYLHLEVHRRHTDFWKHVTIRSGMEDVGECSSARRQVFAGLWTLCSMVV